MEWYRELLPFIMSEQMDKLMAMVSQLAISQKESNDKLEAKIDNQMNQLKEVISAQVKE